MPDVTGSVFAGRAAAESRMLDTFEFRLPTGKGYNPASGDQVETFDVLFTTVGRVKVANGISARRKEAGDRTVVTVTRVLHIPVNSPTVPTGVIAVCTAVDPTSDPSLLGANLRISGPAPGSQTTARRLEVGEVIT